MWGSDKWGSDKWGSGAVIDSDWEVVDSDRRICPEIDQRNYSQYFAVGCSNKKCEIIPGFPTSPQTIKNQNQIPITIPNSIKFRKSTLGENLN